jgi:hypothetical protein
VWKVIGAGVALTALSVLFFGEFVAPGLSVSDGLKTLPETGFFSPKTLGPRLPGYAALDVLPPQALGEAARRAMKLAPSDPRALAVGAAALHRIEQTNVWKLPKGVSAVAITVMALRFLDEETREGSVDAAMDRGLWDASRMTDSYRPSQAMYRWSVAQKLHPDDPRLRALIAQYRDVFGFELVRIQVRDALRAYLPPGSLPDR